MSLITFLGTGTSQGVPVIGCKCEVCTSLDPRDKRLRASLLYSKGDTNIVIDVGPDFRQQMLRAGVEHIDAIFITHEHNDHVIGLDDVRPFNFRSGNPMRIYALPRVAAEIRTRFAYVFGEKIAGIPRIELIEIEPGQTIRVNDIQVETIGIMHGALPILAFKMSNFAYITDMKTIAVDQKAKLAVVQYLVLNALHKHAHHAHMTLAEALIMAEEINAEKTWLTHMSHHMGLTAKVSKELPENVQFAYDTLVYMLPDS